MDNRPAEYLSTRKWGVFSHYLYGLVKKRNLGNSDISWSSAVDRFDVERVAYTLHKMNVGYYFITLMQGTEHMIAPNGTFDSIAGTVPGEACSIRDLPMELSDALGKYGIDLCLYYTGDGPYKHPVIGEKFGYGQTRENLNMDFVSKWGAVLEEYAVRYGDRIKAWWIDGTFDFLGYNEELLSVYYNAIKKGNPDAAVAFNNGVGLKIEKYYSKEEFTAGESREIRAKTPGTKYIDGALSHILFPLGFDPSFVGAGWAAGGMKHPKEYVASYIRELNSQGGIVTVDVLTNCDGSFDPEQEAALVWVGKNV